MKLKRPKSSLEGRSFSSNFELLELHNIEIRNYTHMKVLSIILRVEFKSTFDVVITELDVVSVEFCSSHYLFAGVTAGAVGGAAAVHVLSDQHRREKLMISEKMRSNCKQSGINPTANFIIMNLRY